MRPLLTIFTFFALTTAVYATPPSEPPELTTPPAVATSGFVSAYVEETIPMPVKQVRGFLNRMPIVKFFEPTRNISNPVSSEVLKGKWPNVGSVRRVKLADGHFIIERVVENKPQLFKYQLFTFTSSTGRVVEQVVGEMNFVPVAGGTEFQWSYNVKPRSVFTRPFVRARIREIESYLQNGLTGFAAAATKSVQ